MLLSTIHRQGLSVILFNNLVEDFGFVIGRANKRYTLWKYFKQDNSITLSYIQVLSDKRHIVEQRFPDVFICEELRGEHRLILNKSKGNSKPARAPKTIYDFINIPFGPFNGLKISELDSNGWARIANYDDFTWTDAYGEEFNFEELVINKCIETGCKKINEKWYSPTQLENPKLWMYLANTNPSVAEYSEMCKNLGLQKLMNKWFSPIVLDDEKPWMKTARQILPLIENGEQFSFVAHFNGNSFFFGIPVNFRPEDKSDIYTYYGSSHFLKVTNKKGIKVNKRVKGKTIEVLDYEIVTNEYNEPSVLVNKFNIK